MSMPRIFLGCRSAHRDNLHVERQIHARQRMVRIEQHLIVLDGGHGHDRREAVGVSLKLVADL